MWHGLSRLKFLIGLGIWALVALFVLTAQDNPAEPAIDHFFCTAFDGRFARPDCYTSEERRLMSARADAERRVKQRGPDDRMIPCRPVSPALLEARPDARFFCVGGRLLAIPRTLVEDPDGRRNIDPTGISNAVPIYDTALPRETVFTLPWLIIGSGPDGAYWPSKSTAPTFHRLDLTGMSARARTPDEGDWRSEAGPNHPICDRDSAGNFARIGQACNATFRTGQIEVQYWWHGENLPAEAWPAVDRSAREFLDQILIPEREG